MNTSAKNESSNPVVVNIEDIEIFDRNGKFYFTSEQIGKALGYANGKDSVLELYRRNVLELQDFSTTLKLVAVDGKVRDLRVFDEMGLYILCMLARTQTAQSFRRQVARVLTELREQRLQNAKQLVLETILGMPKGQREHLQRILHYKSLGLSNLDIAKLVGISDTAVGRAIMTARGLGFVADDSLPVACGKPALCGNEAQAARSE